MDNSSREQFQSETGRAIDSLVRPSSLFYTVSGHQAEKQSQPKYYQEILGCPSIIKPSFRDLPGCTRLSVGVPSPSYRQYPLDKLNKTMGKSSTSNPSKRHTKIEKFPPIKVNAKIRHIYSQLTTAPSSHPQSTIASISTQTDFNDVMGDFSEENERLVDNDDGQPKNTRDAFTSISPPPSGENYAFADPVGDKVMSIPSSYLGKLEDLEKITGHIVIQRFFTRADEAFGCWLEKQLGMNSKSVGVDTSDETVQIDGTEKLASSSMEKGFIDSGNDSQLCRIDDPVQCECFKDYFTENTEEGHAVNVNVGLTPDEEELISQCVAYELLGESKTEDAVSHEKNQEDVKGSVHAKETDVRKPRLISQDSIDREVTEELLKNMDQIFAELPIEDYARSQDKVEDDDGNTFECRKSDFKAVVEKVIDAKRDISELLEDTTIVPVSEAIEGISECPQDETTGTSETKEDSVIERIEAGAEVTSERKCIPDVIEVGLLLSSERCELKLEDGISQSALESQTKVAEYLGKIDPSTAAAVEEELDELVAGADERTNGESSHGQQMPEETKEMKRSLSVDSCIGTESSGDTKHGLLNDSGIVLDSGRVDFDAISETMNSAEVTCLESLVKPPDAPLLQEGGLGGECSTQTTEIADNSRLLSNKSMDESIISKSEQSSAIQRGSDGDTEDADQSESDSSELSLRRRRGSGSGMPVVAEDAEFEEVEEAILSDDDDEENEEEPDQFDQIIESHEREKRSRPICRKRNVSTQTSKSVESSIISSSTTTTNTSRSTTANSSNSSFDLEFVSKKYVTNVSSGTNMPGGGGVLTGDTNKRRSSYLPSGASSLNVLNMKFTMGRDFESEFSIRIPNKTSSPSGSVSSAKGISAPSHSSNMNVNPEKEGATTTGPGQSAIRVERSSQSQRPQDVELKSLWKDVKSRMECRVAGESISGGHLPFSRERELLVTGSRMKLVSAYDDVIMAGPSSSGGDGESLLTPRGDPSVSNSYSFPAVSPKANTTTTSFVKEDDERIKRSLKRLKKLLDA